MFERFGLRPVRYFIEMRAPTAGARLLRPPDGIRIVEFSSALLPAVHESHTEAFADHWGFEPRSLGEWAARTVESDLFRSDLSRIALADDQAAAYVLAYDGPEKTVYFGQVGTRRPWRQQGLASTLLTASLAAGAADGKTTASLGVDADSPTGAVSLYERLGFTALHPPFAVYEKPLAC
jgi:ribosomal protein S18 acetylase RimI-like enzyme